jgi:hypothetical protein
MTRRVEDLKTCSIKGNHPSKNKWFDNSTINVVDSRIPYLAGNPQGALRPLTIL